MATGSGEICQEQVFIVLTCDPQYLLVDLFYQQKFKKKSVVSYTSNKSFKIMVNIQYEPCYMLNSKFCVCSDCSDLSQADKS